MSLSELFESVSEKTVSDWIAGKREEDLYLDFKEAASTDLSHKDDRKNFAVALSGFANADGGLVVWGVTARYDPATKINCATAPVPIADTKQFLTKLNEFTGQFVSPLVPGVHHREIVTKGTAGFAVTIIPASDLGPHMAKGGEGRYYRRSGDSFRPMEHYEIADMFGRRPKPVLKVVASLHSAGSVGSGGFREHFVEVSIGINNSGRGMARAPYLAMIVRKPYSIPGDRPEGLPRIPQVRGDSQTVTFGGSADVVIPPGTTRAITYLRVAAKSELSGVTHMPEPLEITYQVVADGLALEENQMVIPSDVIALHAFPNRLYQGGLG